MNLQRKSLRSIPRRLLLKILYALFETKELVEVLDTYKLYLFNQLILPEVDELNVFHFPVYIQSHQ